MLNEKTSEAIADQPSGSCDTNNRSDSAVRVGTCIDPDSHEAILRSAQSRRSAAIGGHDDSDGSEASSVLAGVILNPSVRNEMLSP